VRRAVAIDLGATSGRYALGELVDGQIRFTVVRQIPHEAEERNGVLYWDLPTIKNLCDEAAEYAKEHGANSVGIDSWGVDHGFIDSTGELVQAPVCYRDRSHLAAFESLASVRSRLYALTGIQHQPFNTICQLIARRSEAPDLPARAQWMILPDLLGYLLSRKGNNETTQASTTQLQALDGHWSPEAFELAGWPVPELQPSSPGVYGGTCKNGVKIAHVGSHDTASAVAGFGRLSPSEMFLNAGTWSLAGVVVDDPIATPQAEIAAFTNERTVDGRIRFLKNIPGFYVVNRLHRELGVQQTVAQWLGSAADTELAVDLFHPDFFNPESMVDTCLAQLSERPRNQEAWAGVALASMANAVASTIGHIQSLTGRTINSIRVGGGGSQSPAFCTKLATRCGMDVIAGPAEVTVLGNLAAQFLAAGEFGSWDEAYRAVEVSEASVKYAS